MTAQPPNLDDAATEAEIKRCFDLLFDVHRQRIAKAWALGKIDSDDAMTRLIELDLIESKVLADG